MEELVQAQQKAIETCKKMTDEGVPIDYIRSNFFPADSTCFCMFKADTAFVVEKVNIDANLAYDEVTEVIDLPNPD